MAVVYLVRRIELDARRRYPAIQHLPQGCASIKKALSILVFTLLDSFGRPGTATPAAAQDQDPPTRVARLNYIQGSISYQLAREQDWLAADPNRPLTSPPTATRFEPSKPK